MRKAISAALVVRAAAYCGLLLIYVNQISPLNTKRLISLVLILFVLLLQSALFSIWLPIARFSPAISAFLDLILVTLLILQGFPFFVFLLIWVIVADGILAGWQITLVLGTGAMALTLILETTQLSFPFQLQDKASILIFWLGLTALTAAWARRREKEHILRSNLEDNLQVRSDRLSMLSHEVRTPLTLMHTSLELLFDESAGKLTKQQRTFLENVYQNEERITTLAQNLLTQAKLEAGVFSPKIQPVDLRQVIRDAVKDTHTVTDQRNQRISTYYPQVLPAIPLDPDLIRQVLINLIQNASRFSSEGGRIIITISQNVSNILIAVTDDGAGMDFEHRSRLFRQFSTFSNRPGGGTGLGLVIVKNIIERHGGQVYVDTYLGRGTSFYVTLPLTQMESKSEKTPFNFGRR